MERLGRFENGGTERVQANRSIGPAGERGGERSRRSSACRWFEELSHGVLGSSCVVAVSLGEVVESPLDAHDGDGEIGQAGEVARQVTGAHPATVFVVGDVAHVMEAILD